MPDDKRKDLAQEIYRLCYLRGSFVLRSGRNASRYFDKYQFESDPIILDAVVQELAPLVPPGVDLLAGLEMGGIPIVTALSRFTGIPAVFVRKKAKEHGTARLAEGPNVTGKHLLIVEDVVTSGGQIVMSAEELRRLGATVTTALCVVDREEGGREGIAASRIELVSLFLGSEIERAGNGT